MSGGGVDNGTSAGGQPWRRCIHTWRPRPGDSGHQVTVVDTGTFDLHWGPPGYAKDLTMALPSCRGLALVLIHLLACVSFASRTRNYRDHGPRITDVRLPTKQGRIRGLVQHYGGDITYTKFLGIPYAQAPVGDRRFKEPAKHTGWALSNELNATYYRPFCISNRRSRGSQPRHRHYTESEDCLYLNLYIPRNLSYVRHVNTLGLPVVVFIHGWTKDDGIDRADNTWSMAAAGDLIVAQVRDFIRSREISKPWNWVIKKN